MVYRMFEYNGDYFEVETPLPDMPRIYRNGEMLQDYEWCGCDDALCLGWRPVHSEYESVSNAVLIGLGMVDRSKIKQIVIAWVSVSMEWDGLPFQVDLGRKPVMKRVRTPNAVVWLNAGTEADVVKAEAYCARENPAYLSEEERMRVIVLQGSDDPIAEAKRIVMQASTSF